MSAWRTPPRLAPPIWAAASNSVLFAVLTVLPMLALIIAGLNAVFRRGQPRTLWLCLALFVAGGLSVQMWEIRGAYLANVYAGFPFAWLFGVAGEWAGRMSMALTRVLLRVVPPLVLASLPVMAGMVAARTVDEALSSASSDQFTNHGCDPTAFAAALRPLAADRGPLLIAAPIDLGPSLLLLTPQQVLAAPYHRNTEGLRDIRRLLYADAASVEEVIRRRGVDLIVSCPNDALAASFREEGVVPFSDQLRDGKVPNWLWRVETDGAAQLFVVEGT